MKSDPLKPELSLLCKLGSIAVHADELLSPSGHEFDRHAMASLFHDAEVRQWLRAMQKLALVPEKR